MKLSNRFDSIFGTKIFTHRNWIKNPVIYLTIIFFIFLFLLASCGYFSQLVFEIENARITNCINDDVITVVDANKNFCIAWTEVDRKSEQTLIIYIYNDNIPYDPVFKYEVPDNASPNQVRKNNKIDVSVNLKPGSYHMEFVLDGRPDNAHIYRFIVAQHSTPTATVQPTPTVPFTPIVTTPTITSTIDVAQTLDLGISAAIWAFAETIAGKDETETILWKSLVNLQAEKMGLEPDPLITEDETTEISVPDIVNTISNELKEKKGDDFANLFLLQYHVKSGAMYFGGANTLIERRIEPGQELDADNKLFFIVLQIQSYSHIEDAIVNAQSIGVGDELIQDGQNLLTEIYNPDSFSENTINLDSLKNIDENLTGWSSDVIQAAQEIVSKSHNQ